MADIKQLRERYPQYNDLSDTEFADKYHTKYYSDIPKQEFYSKLGIKSEPDHPAAPQKPEPGLATQYLDYLSAQPLGLLQGGGDIGASIGNFGISGLEHLTGGQLPRIPHPNLRRFYPESTGGQAGGAVGEFIPETIVPGGPGRKLLAATPKYLKALAGAAGGGLWGAASHEDNRGLGGLIGAGAAAIPGTIKAGKSISEWYRTPAKKLKETQDLLSNMKKGILGHEQELETAKTNMAKMLNEEHKGSLAAEEQSKTALEQNIPNIAESQVNKQQVNAITQAKKDLGKSFRERYAEFNEGEAGQKPVSKPFEVGELEEQIKNIGGVPASTKKMAGQIAQKAGEEIEIPSLVNVGTGKAYTIKIPPKIGAKTVDYINFYRETRDAASEAFYQAKNAATHGQKMDLVAKGQQLKKMSQDVEKRVHESLTPDEQKVFSKIQNDYRNHMVPLNESTTLRNVVNNREAAPNLMSKMLQPRQYKLHEHLLNNQPSYREAMLAQRFSGKGHPLSPKSLEAQGEFGRNLIKNEPDFYKLLSPEAKQALTMHGNIAKNRKMIEGLRATVTQPNFHSVLHAIEREGLKDFSPATKAAMERIEKANMSKASLEREAKEMGIKVEDLRNAIVNRRWTGGAKGVATTVLLAQLPSKLRHILTHY